MAEKILVTGASGFIGSFLVEGGLQRDMQVWAGIRKSSSRRYLQDERITPAILDFTDSEHLEAQLLEHKREHGGWDYIIHCAGVTKCRDEADFEIGNYWATRHFIEVLQKLQMVPRIFVYLSSLSVFGPVRETDYSEISEYDTPQPNTAYGKSKLLAEQYLHTLSDFPFVIFRPTGVYGPRERDYFLMAQSIARHVDFMAGWKRQDLTFVYVKDLVKAVYLGIEKKAVGRSYFVTDGAVYASTAFSDLIKNELGNPWIVRLKCPLGLLKAISYTAGWLAALMGKTSTLNRDKYNIMKQRNWRCDITPLQQELGYRADYPLERGVKETIAWYNKEGWI